MVAACCGHCIRILLSFPLFLVLCPRLRILLLAGGAVRQVWADLSTLKLATVYKAMQYGKFGLRGHKN